MKYLRTNIHEIETAEELQKIINENENVMVCCGRMGPMCIPVYEIMEELEEERPEVKFYSTMYYKSGKVAKATTSIQNMQQITSNLDQFLS